MIYLLRHGQTNYNHEGRMQGQLESQLTDLGMAQAQAMAGHLLIQAGAALQHGVALGDGNPRPIIVHPQAIAPIRHADLQLHAAGRPFAGVIEQVAQEFVQVLGFACKGNVWRLQV